MAHRADRFGRKPRCVVSAGEIQEHKLAGDILGFATAGLPSDQLDSATMRAPQPRADALLFAAASALHRLLRKELDDFWRRSPHGLARLWRMLMQRDMRPHRRTQVVPDRATSARGECIATSQGSSHAAFCSRAVPSDISLLAQAPSTLTPEDRHFAIFTAPLYP